MRQIGQEVSALWSDKQTDKQRLQLYVYRYNDNNYNNNNDNNSKIEIIIIIIIMIIMITDQSSLGGNRTYQRKKLRF